MHIKKALIFLACIGLFTQLFAPEREQEKGVFRRSELKELAFDVKNEIYFGQTGFFSGHFELYGDQIRHGILSYFKRINHEGGIKGRKLRLISVHDYGRPEIAVKNIKRMQELGIDMFLGTMGTRTLLAQLQDLKELKVAQLFPWGGDDKLRSPEVKGIVSGLGNTTPQIKKLIEHIVKEKSLRKIAIFHADSDFGTRNAHQANEFLSEHNITALAMASYNRYTMDIDRPAKELIQADPKIVICLSSSTPTAKLIAEFFQKGYFGTQFIGIDSTLFVGDILEQKGARFTFSSMVPDPEDSKLKIALDYLDDLHKYYPKENPNVLSFAYYIHAALVGEACKKVKGTLTKEKIIEELEKNSGYSLGGFNVTFDHATRHAYKHPVSIVEG